MRWDRTNVTDQGHDRTHVMQQAENCALFRRIYGFQFK